MRLAGVMSMSVRLQPSIAFDGAIALMIFRGRCLAFPRSNTSCSHLLNLVTSTREGSRESLSPRAVPPLALVNLIALTHVSSKQMKHFKTARIHLPHHRESPGSVITRNLQVLTLRQLRVLLDLLQEAPDSHPSSAKPLLK